MNKNKRSEYKRIVGFIILFSIFLYSLGKTIPTIDKRQKPKRLSVAYAATAGANNCSTGTQDTTVIGTRSWTVPGNACADGASTSATGISMSGLESYLLKMQNFGFSIPTGSSISGISFTVTRGTTSNKGNRSTDALVRIIKSNNTYGSQDKSNGSSYSTSPVTYGNAADLWNETWTAADINSSSFGIAISAMSTGSNTVTATIYGYTTAMVYYNAPPNAPTQEAPANNATNVSITPTFEVTATDPEADNVMYKVVVYSNSACSTVVQTYDQDVSQTGWTGTNTLCGAKNCYSSGTQGTYTAQSALSGGTQYWWRAYAKDPEGSNYYAPSSTCHSFTTASTVSVTITSSGTIAYSITPLNTSKSSANIGQSQTVQNNSAITENLNIKTSNAIGGTTWTLGANPGSNVYVLEYMAAGDSGYTKFTTPDAYQSFVTGLGASSSKNFDLRITTPTSTSDYVQKSITVTIQAVAP